MQLRRIVTVLCILTAMLVAAEGPTPTVLASPDATAPDLASARSFGVLGGSTVTNTGVTTVTGDVGVSPGPSVTGFPPGIMVNGTIHQNDATAIQAHADADLAYDDLVNQTCDTDLSGQDLGGMTLTPGSYCFSSSADLNGILTLNAQSNPAAIFLFQIGTTLTTASNASVVMTNGGLACKVYWQVGSSATLGTNTAFAGNILADQSITMTTSSSLSGRALAINAAVTLDTNSVSNAACFGPLAITVQGFRAQPPGRGFDLGAGALLLILGLLFMRRPVQAIVDPCSYDGKAQAT